MHLSAIEEAVQYNRALKVLAALAVETRLRAFQAVSDAGDDGVISGEIARKLNVPHSTLSDHLGILTSAGIVTKERRSRSIIYRADMRTVEELAKFLTERQQTS